VIFLRRADVLVPCWFCADSISAYQHVSIGSALHQHYISIAITMHCPFSIGSALSAFVGLLASGIIVLLLTPMTRGLAWPISGKCGTRNRAHED
jgi:hypothetical protein